MVATNESIQTKIFPVMVAYRGFQYGLPIDWIYDGIERSLRDGTVKGSHYIRWPGGQPIPVRFTKSLVERWKGQYDDGVKLDIPRELWSQIDKTLGVYGPQW